MPEAHDALREYLDLGEKLAVLDNESPEAERIRTVMDLIWYRLTAEERAALDNADDTLRNATKPPAED